MAAVDLVALIKAKQAQIAKLQAELEGARAALVAALQAPAARGGDARARAMRRLRRGVKRLAASRTASEAAKILQASARPLHVAVIQQRLRARGHRLSTATLVSTLSRWVRSRAVFYREKPNVFGLRKRRGNR